MEAHNLPAATSDKVVSAIRISLCSDITSPWWLVIRNTAFTIWRLIDCYRKPKGKIKTYYKKEGSKESHAKLQIPY